MSAAPPTGLSQALTVESAKKSRVCWLSWPGASRPRLVWHVWYDGALVVLSGDGDQHLPGLVDGVVDGVVAEVTMRSKDTGGRLLTWAGAVEVVTPDAPGWDDHVAALLGVRLNLADPAAAATAWRTTGTVLRIVPVDTAGDESHRPLP